MAETSLASAETLIDLTDLSRSTGECGVGPLISMQPGKVAVRYDVETGTGSAWTTLTFIGAVALRVIPAPAVDPLLVRAYSKVGVVKDSRWVEAVMRSQGDGRLSQGLKHFAVFFDHYGSIETIAQSWEVQNDP